jgi:ATP-binding cassette subfamily B protein
VAAAPAGDGGVDLREATLDSLRRQIVFLPQEGHLFSGTLADNVRLAHRVCNQRDYIWRKKINALLGKRMSLEEIAEKLNAEKVPTIHGTNRWTAASVRKAFVS